MLRDSALYGVIVVIYDIICEARYAPLMFTADADVVAARERGVIERLLWASRHKIQVRVRNEVSECVVRCGVCVCVVCR